MATHVSLLHHTRYEYERHIQLSPQVIRLRPAPHSRTPVLSYSLKLSPEPHFLNWQQDPFGNYLARVVFPERVDHFEVSVEVIADLTAINPFDFFLEEFAEELPFAYPADTLKELAPYLECVEAGPRLSAFLNTLPPPEEIRTIDWLVAMNQAVQQVVSYRIRMEPGVQTCEETLTLGSGSCRDSAWLLCQCMRAAGYAARFVSGYLVQLKPDDKPLEGPAGPEEDFTDLHAWCEVFVPGAGWIGLDPTSGLFAAEGHIPLAATPTPSSAAPIEGKAESCKTEFFFENRVTRVHEDPRVTLPYSDSEWERVLSLGDAVDEVLKEEEISLTMGGEPTFISIDDMEGDEWNTTADSSEKRKLGYQLLCRLRDRFASGGMLHIGEGKWYPGEELPRWAYSVVWRTDGLPLWTNPDLLADPTASGELTSGADEAFLQQLCRELALPEHTLMPAYEDVAYYLWREGTLPVDIDPADPRLAEGLERKFLADLLDRGLGTPSGTVLPLQFDSVQDQWTTCSWSFRRKHLFLVPGNSPVGLRLPLDSLALPAPHERPQPVEGSPLEPRAPLPASAPVPEQPEVTDNTFSTALCAEIREGRLHVFLPPQTDADCFFALLQAVERAAAVLKQPVILEGYPPPHDPRLREVKVTPDPGVIEVNLQPGHSWREQVEITTALYEEAKQCRLGTEKFMLDGRHSGTGGGNHVTLGGPTPDQSPFLRNPGLLRSMITCWQHHPSLSYLFSGNFIGPTSQAPRVDEGRDDRLHELEIAFSQLPSDDNTPPWLVDRILRNQLTDLTGNTHRAEFCIDKLYSPDSSSGRLGLVELRGFEMPPHARMSLVQQLLVRMLVARFSRHPWHRKLIPWGTRLHDQFLLPHFVREDLHLLLEECAADGFEMDPAWFEPFLEFRFPRFGTRQVGNVRMELRFAIEPWHVLGEESTSSGTARYVDSSAERVQIQVDGLIPERQAVTCNGHRIPLVPTQTRGRFVAGVRYQAWSPWSALHPTLSPQSPLVFDVVDLFQKKSLGGFSYFVSHPGGRSYETSPVNALEAEARRVARFWQQGHTQDKDRVSVETIGSLDSTVQVAPHDSLGPFQLDEPDPDPDFPCTFDLRGIR